MEIRYCGICGTHFKIYHDHHSYYRPPLVPGHEFSGVVVEVEKEVSGISVGDEVVVAPPAMRRDSLYGRSRNPWPYSQRGFEAEWGFTKYGGFAKYAVCDEQNILKLSEEVDLESAALTEPLAVHGIHDDAPGYFSDETPKTMQQVVSEIASAYNAEAMAVFRFLIQRRITIIEKPQQKECDR